MRRAVDPEIAAQAAEAAEAVEVRPDPPAATRARIAYYLAEAVRVEALAAVTPGAGRERFLQAAEEYRGLAAWLERTGGRVTLN